MGMLPSGTVTFLFTDIEGSTRLAQQFPDALPRLLARHNEILDHAIAAHDGYVFQTAGDSYSAAFHNAEDALYAALDAQRRLQQEAWSPAPVKVRMGLHTGSAELQTDGKEARYSGYATLALAQRVMSAGHGGQVLLSHIARGLVTDRLPGDITLRDMGECRLKDVFHTERLYQLVVPDLLSDFQPLNTLDTFNHNLPTQLTSFVGRQSEVEALRSLIRQNRIVTLTGSGGCGKTRLSMYVAGELLSDFRHGAWLVELAPLSDPALMPRALIAVLNLREDNQRTPLEILIDYLRTRKLLLILDNCEHIIEACAQLSEALLRACPHLTILASSREALGIAGEVPYRVPSLKTPDPVHVPPPEELIRIDAVRLFLERAVIVKPGFTLTEANASFIAQICHRLDGIPLAIELAAARIKVLSPEQVAARLDDRFRLLTGGARTALPRQQTLRAMIDWSYSLLSEPEKILFRRLAVFVGGWTLEAAEFVCADAGQQGIAPYDILDLLTRLVDKSLVFSEESTGEIRYHRLETIQQYSREKFFETGEVESIRDRHLAFFTRFSEETKRHMQGQGRKVWARRSETEEDNLNAAIEWGLARKPADSLRIAVNMIYAIAAGGFSVAGFRWLRESMDSLEKTLPSTQPELRADALSALGFIYLSLGANLPAKECAEQSVALYRELGDRNGLAAALLVCSQPLEFLGNLEQAAATLNESLALARSENNAFIGAWALNTLARVTAKLHGDIAAALDYTEQAIHLAREADIQWQVANAYDMRGFLSAYSNDYLGARTHFEKALLIYEDVGAHFNAILSKSSLAHLERQFGHTSQALDRYRESILAFRDVGQIGAVAHQLECFGFLAMAESSDSRAARLFAAAHALRRSSGMEMTPDEQGYYDAQIKCLRERMPAPKFAAAWATGGGLSMDDAIMLAIGAQDD